MEIAQTVINAAMVALVGLGLTWLARGQRREARADLAEFRREVKQEFVEVKHEFLEVRREISEVRSDLTRVALAVGAKPKAANS